VKSRRWEEIAELCGEALELPASDRIAFLRERCGADSVLRGEVESLLSVAAQPGLLDSPPRGHEFEPAALVAGRFRIIRLLGYGGMGQVYQADDLQLGGQVALKTIRPELLHNPQSVEFFKREIQLAKKVTHANVCRIYDIGFHPSPGDPGARMFLTMELLEGETLSKRLAAGAVSPPDALPLVRQMADALGAAHSAGIVHRDFKSGNVMLVPAPDGFRAVVMDFGLARTSTAGVKGTTQTLETVGTPEYMAPEQLTGGAVTPATDIYALGIVMYEMVTGQRPFSGDTPFDVAVRRLHEAPLPPRELKPELDVRWERTILRCLSRQPEDRFQSTADVVLALSGTKILTAGRRRKRSRWIAGAAASLLAASAAAYFLARQARPKLTGKDTIVLSEFTNNTGDTVFDGALRQGLSAQLAQSPFLNLLPDSRITETLALMGLKGDTRLTPSATREVCQRTAGAATVEGSISRLGSQYVIGLNAIDCRTGNALAQEQTTANGKEQVIQALGDAATKLRRKLGESLASVQKYDAPPENVTTSSLEALKAYSLGRVAAAKGDISSQISLYQRAIALDPNFAMAFAALGLSYSSLGENSLGRQSLRRAFELRDHVSSNERFAIESSYWLADGDLEDARRIHEIFSQTFPRNVAAHNNLGVIYNALGEHEKAIEQKLAALRLGAYNYAGVVSSYLFLDRLVEAQKIANEALSKPPEQRGSNLRTYLYQLAFLKNDRAAMLANLNAAMGTSEEGDLLYFESDTQAYQGHLANARKLTRRAVDWAQRSGYKEVAAAYEAEDALREALFLNSTPAPQMISDMLALSRAPEVEFAAALALTSSMRAPNVRKMTDDLQGRFPKDTHVRFNFLPTLRAQMELANGQPVKAIETLETAVPYELGFTGNAAFSPDMYPIYSRAQAYLAARRGLDAAAEFRKILEHPGVVLNGPQAALARLGLGRAYALAGNRTKAKTAYEDFLHLWNGADPEIPILKLAHAEYARLQ